MNFFISSNCASDVSYDVLLITVSNPSKYDLISFTNCGLTASALLPVKLGFNLFPAMSVEHTGSLSQTAVQVHLF